MMYDNKLVLALKANGKVLREVKDTVYIPWGTEYSILLKNLNSVRAIVNIQVDGQEVCDGGFVVDANSEVNIERFVKNLSKGNRFKFIERTTAIEDGPRGIKVDDGLIRVSFKYEKVADDWLAQSRGVIHHHYHPYIPPNYTPTHYEPTIYGSGVSTMIPMSAVSSVLRGTTPQASNHTLSPMGSTIVPVAATNEVGITVPGSLSDQKFTTVAAFATEAEEHVMVLRILGETAAGKQVTQPVTVAVKPKCATCGRTNKANNKFCSQCGTALEIV